MSICLQASKVDVFIGWCCYCNKAPQTWCREPKFTVSQFCRSATCVSLTGGLRKRKPVCQPGCVLIWGLGILIHQTIFGRLGSCGCRTEALFPRESPRPSHSHCYFFPPSRGPRAPPSVALEGPRGSDLLSPWDGNGPVPSFHP